ncbi:MAG: mechanosensitive ion channel family protein [Gammaproteobacteria bacterium]|nr:mechanosensitive ion channel family protein [Gammaproteobacteria bacterium]
MNKMISNRSPSCLAFRSIGLFAALWFTFAVFSPAHAQMVPSSEPTETGIEIAENLTQQQARDLIARLSDEEVREIVIKQMDKLASESEPKADPAVYVNQLQTGIKVAKNSFKRILTADHQIGALPIMIWVALTENGRISGWLLLLQFVALLVAGGIAEGLARRLLSQAGSQATEIQSPGKRFNLACYEMIKGMIGLGAFAAGAILLIEFTAPQMKSAQSFWYQVLWCLILLKLVVLAVRVLVSPGRSDNRLVTVSDSTAQQMLAWSVLLVGSLVLPRPLVAIVTDFGADTDTALLLSMTFGTLFITLLIVLIVRLRHYGAALILGDDDETGSIRQGLARIWWLLSIVYVLAIWFMSIGKRAATGESSLVPGIGSLLLLVMIPYADRGLTWLVTWYFRDKTPATDSAEVAGDDATEADVIADGPDTSETVVAKSSDLTPGYIAIALRYSRIIMSFIILGIFFRLWEIDIRAISAELIGPRFASALFDISITILLTWTMWGIIRISIERKLNEGKSGDDAEGDGEAGGLGGTRVETVLPLIRASIKITLVVMAVLISLSAVGVNIGPLIAGAGVIGIAIGFGAQTLVRDIVSGFFYLLDDAFRIGEYVVIDQIRGTVEKISIRSFQLRHHEGPVHTIPYGEIRTLTNWSRDWAIMKFELRVPFETDIEMVRKMIKQIGLDMIDSPQFGPLMLAPLKSQGVNRIDDSALIIRCKFTAIPGQQYLIRREAFTRIQRVFEEKGIQFAPRRVLVEATSPEEAVKAAAAAIDQEPPADKSKPPPM